MSILVSEFSSVNDFKLIVDKLVENIKPESLIGKSTKGEKSLQYDLLKFVNVDENFSFVIDKIKEKTKEEIQKNYEGIKVNNLSVTSSWVVYGDKGSYHTVHRHNNDNVSHVATVTYLKTTTQKTPKAGNLFYFLDNEVYDLNLNEGQMVIMPIWLLHGTYPQSEGLRQTLNIDFFVECF